MTLYTASIIAIIQDVQGQIEDNSKGLIEELSKAIEQLKTLDKEHEEKLRADLALIHDCIEAMRTKDDFFIEVDSKLSRLEHILIDRIKDLDGK